MSPPADGLPHAAGITASPTACLVGSISVCFPSREHSGAPRRVGLGRGGSEAASPTRSGLPTHPGAGGKADGAHGVRERPVLHRLGGRASTSRRLDRRTTGAAGAAARETSPRGPSEAGRPSGNTARGPRGLARAWWRRAPRGGAEHQDACGLPEAVEDTLRRWRAPRGGGGHPRAAQGSPRRQRAPRRCGYADAPSIRCRTRPAPPQTLLQGRAGHRAPRGRGGEPGTAQSCRTQPGRSSALDGTACCRRPLCNREFMACCHPACDRKHCPSVLCLQTYDHRCAPTGTVSGDGGGSASPARRRTAQSHGEERTWHTGTCRPHGCRALRAAGPRWRPWLATVPTSGTRRRHRLCTEHRTRSDSQSPTQGLFVRTPAKGRARISV